MTGDERVRHCAQCDLSVYNLTALSHAQIEELVSAREGRLCVRLYKRRDGTMITRDCPVGFEMKVRRISKVAGAALSAAMSTVPLAAQVPSTTRDLNPSGTLEMQVTDLSGAIIPNACVVLRDENTGFESRSHADANGLARVENLASGKYSLIVDSNGFASSRQTIDVLAGEAKQVEIHMDIGEALQGGPMGTEVVYAEPVVLPISTRIMPIVPTEVVPPPIPQQNWFKRFLRKIF